MKNRKVAVLGGGAFGLALSILLAKKSFPVHLWARSEEVVWGINNNRRHPKELITLELPSHIHATTDLDEALHKADFVVLALPMSALHEVLKKASFSPHAKLISTAKGILCHSLELPCDIIEKSLGAEIAYKACYLSGPSFAIELALGLPTALTIASHDQASAQMVQKNFTSSNCRFYWSDDVVGVCVGGALKNVIAIAAGAASELKLGRNALAALITRGLAEITRLAQKMGAKSETMSGLAGMGDLVLSCTDNLSRNHRLGILLAQGMTLAHALREIGTVVEGAKTAQAIPALIKKYGVEMPISYTVYRVLYEALTPENALSSLLDRIPNEERS